MKFYFAAHVITVLPKEIIAVSILFMACSSVRNNKLFVISTAAKFFTSLSEKKMENVYTVLST